MPRRGERQRVFPDINQPSEPARIGARAVCAHGSRGVPREVRLDPARFRCAGLAAELADEWVDYATISTLAVGRVHDHRQAIEAFCRTVDDMLGDAAPAASLGRPHPDLGFVLAEWERRLPTRHRPGSTRPAALASAIRALIARRAEHDQRPVDDGLLRLIQGELGVEWGATQEIDEFSRKDKTLIVRAAWAHMTELERRLTRGWESARQGRHPAEHGWTDVANLLWGLAEQAITPAEIASHLPAFRDWPDELRECVVPAGGTMRANLAKSELLRWLVRQLFPNDLDLHPYRVLLVAATGRAPEEVTGLTEDGIEFFPGGVRLTLVKNRAGHVRHRTFRDGGSASQSAVAGEVADFADQPRREVSTILRHLLKTTQQARSWAADRDRQLFVAGSVTPKFELKLDRWEFTGRRLSFRHWLSTAGIQVAGAPDVRRLRKSTKVEKAIAFGGRIADSADDHHEETFRGHYAQGTTLRMLSGQVISTSQNHWLDKALNGPTVLTDDAAALEQPDRLDALGLTEQEAEHLRQGALDMGVTSCRDPYDSPYSRKGQLCAVAPLRCLECRNAWVLPSNLAQLLLFADHLEQLRRRLSPQHFGSLWGQSYVNLHAALAERTDEDITLARKHIESEDSSLHLPLSSHVEFDT